MWLRKITIKNFRNFENTSINLEEFSALVGPNNIGKTSILQALNYIFSQTNPRNIPIYKVDFHDSSKPIVIDVFFDSLSSDDIALFYHEDGVINPQTNTITIRFVSMWSSLEQDVKNECYFIREDLPEGQQRIVDFYLDFRQALPFFVIGSDRNAFNEIGITKNRDLGKVLRLYSSDYLKPLITLRSEILNTFEEIKKGIDNWLDF